MIQEMVAKNPKLGMAHVYRWRYSDEFLKSAAPDDDQNVLRSAAANDIQEALELAPDDPEVLFDRGHRERAETRTQPRREFTSRRVSSSIPRTSPWPLAWLAWRPGNDISIGPRPSCGRRMQANPSVALAFMLAENLIAQDKIEGKDQAATFMTRLRDNGSRRHPRPLSGSRDPVSGGRSGPRQFPRSRWPGRS